jgi:DNA-binding XRE family transcriptional regulator
VPSHPNRGNANRPGRNPKPAEIKAARESVGLSQARAAEVVYVATRTWEDWESTIVTRRMHPGLWQLFCIKVGLPDPYSTSPKG